MQLYEIGLGSGSSGDGPVRFDAVGEDGSRRRLPLERWLRRAAAGEEQVLSRAYGPVLDVGCGVGRHLIALEALGIEATGVELSSFAAAIARERGAKVLEGSIFDVPKSGMWGTALLLDGNIGIGGEPSRLLARVAELVRPGGRVLVEVEPPRTRTRLLRLRLESPREMSDWIPWAWVGADAIGPLARAAGLGTEELWSVGQRWFALLRREHEPWLG